jgi:hypothetical protein
MPMLTFSALELIDLQENAEGTPVGDLITRFSKRAKKRESGTLRDPWLGSGSSNSPRCQRPNSRSYL